MVKVHRAKTAPAAIHNFSANPIQSLSSLPSDQVPRSRNRLFGGSPRSFGRRFAPCHVELLTETSFAIDHESLTEPAVRGSELLATRTNPKEGGRSPLVE